jgi:hypothetical protein
MKLSKLKFFHIFYKLHNIITYSKLPIIWHVWVMCRAASGDRKKYQMAGENMRVATFFK